MKDFKTFMMLCGAMTFILTLFWAMGKFAIMAGNAFENGSYLGLLWFALSVSAVFVILYLGTLGSYGHHGI